MGAERKTAVITAKTAKCTAYHEAGHALVATLTEGADPIHKATIMPRGSSLGMVMQLPEGDQTSQSKKEMLARMDVCMGGRVAEELVFGERSGVLVDPSEEKLKAEFEGVKRSYLPMHAIVRIDEVTKEGVGKITEAKGNISPFPMPAFTPKGGGQD